MGRLYSFFMMLWGGVILALVVGVGGSIAFELIQHGEFHVAPVAQTFFRAYRLWMGSGLLLLAWLTLWARHDKALAEFADFALLKSCKKLCPQDFGFRVSNPGEDTDMRDRPFSFNTYISRTFFTDDRPSPEFSEGALARALRVGTAFLLIGQPLEGKTRTVFEILKRMRGCFIVRPHTNVTASPSQNIFRLLRRRRVILLVDDLSDYVRKIDPANLNEMLRQSARTCVIAATCRDGPELQMVKKEFRRFYEDIPLKLRFIPITTQQKSQLAHDVGKTWHERASDLLPTPGSITMAEPLRAMRERFDALLPEQADAMRALRLLVAAGVLPLTHLRLQTIWKSVFGRIDHHLGDCLDSLPRTSYANPLDKTQSNLSPPIY